MNHIRRNHKEEQQTAFIMVVGFFIAAVLLVGSLETLH